MQLYFRLLHFFQLQLKRQQTDVLFLLIFLFLANGFCIKFLKFIFTTKGVVHFHFIEMFHRLWFYRRGIIMKELPKSRSIYVCRWRTFAMSAPTIDDQWDNMPHRRGTIILHVCNEQTLSEWSVFWRHWLTNLLHRQTGGHTVVVRPFFVLLDRCTNFKIITQFMAMRWNEKERTNNRSKGNYLIFCDSRTSVSMPKWTEASAV